MIIIQFSCYNVILSKTEIKHFVPLELDIYLKDID